ncbi:MAG: amidohydrolase family protein [Peptococcaceae bacterium]|nr:amidohydrolase family protein [Peptococcaceae bacterium]
MMRALDSLPAGMYWMARIMHQTPDPDEGEIFSISNLAKAIAEPRLLRVAEITRWPLLAEGNESVLRAITLAKAHGKGLEGHTSGCSYERLNVMAVAGIESCHESITAEDVVQRLRLGFWTVLRHSSLRPDLPELLRAVTDHKVHTGRLMFTTDGSCPAFLMREGFTDGMLRTAVRADLNPVTAIQMATVNPAVYLGLDREIGSIAPGRRADILLLPDLESFCPRLVVAGGRVVAVDGELCEPLPEPDWFSLGLRTRIPPLKLISNPSTYGLPASEPVAFPVIEVVSAAITRLKEMPVQVREGFLDCGEDLLYCTIIDRYGRWITSGFVQGLGRFEALATTFNAPYGLMVLGRDRKAMAGAAVAVSAMGGGIVPVEGGRSGVVQNAPEVRRADGRALFYGGGGAGGGTGRESPPVWLPL